MRAAATLALLALRPPPAPVAHNRLLLPCNARAPTPAASQFTTHSLAARAAPFCLETALLLAGFAFESYNQPDIKWETAPDGVRTGYLSPAFIREYYDGVLAVDAVAASLFRPNSLLPLQPLDTFLMLQVGSGDPIRCDAVRGSETPRWNSPSVLFVRGDDASLVISIHQIVPLTGEERLLGRALVPVQSLRHKSIELWGKQHALTGGGRVELKAQYVAFDDGEDNQQSSVDLAALGSQLQSGELMQVAETIGGAFASWRAYDAVASTTGTSGERRGSRLVSSTKVARSLTDPTTWLTADPAGVETPRGPKGAAGVDWAELGDLLGGAASASDAFEACCFVDSPQTNTQAGIWRQLESKTLIVSFRGTQQDEITDILTDLSFLQQPATRRADESSEPELIAAVAAGRDAAALMETRLGAALAALRSSDLEHALEETASIVELRAELSQALARRRDFELKVTREREVGDRFAAAVGDTPSSVPMVHSGFYNALKSVLPRLLKLLEMLMGDQDGWTLYVTGHSLGGALATLFAWEAEALRRASLPSVRRVVLYNFGSPRVGNAAFAASFNEAISTAFRIVNRDDIVARVPSASLPGGEWLQVGRTALIRADGGESALWVQGEDEGECPISLEEEQISTSVGPVGGISLLRMVLAGSGVSDHFEDEYHAGMVSAIEAWRSRSVASQPAPLLSMVGAARAYSGGAAASSRPEADPQGGCSEDTAKAAAIDSVVREELDALLAGAATEEAQMRSSDSILASEKVLGRIGARVHDTVGDDADVDIAILSSVRRELVRILEDGRWNMEDLSLLLRIALLLGAQLTPAASILPVRALLDVYGASLADELGSKVLDELGDALKERMRRGISDSVRGFTGKDEYEFGDLSRAAIRKVTGSTEMKGLSSLITGNRRMSEGGPANEA